MDIQKAALFALDAYNRESATVAVPYDAQVIASDVEGGFAAVAYYLADTNELVVSFRGTDNPSFFGFPLVDAITGWPIGNGVYDGIQSQANLAFAFYNDLKALVSDPSSPAYSAEWCFTGHSLGGGLAGLVASTKGLPAYVYDSMPFTEAANNLYADVSGPDAANHSYWSNLAYPDGVMNPPSFSQITSYAIEDEVNSNLRYGTPFVVAGRDAILTSGLDSQIIQQNEIRAGAVENIVDLHSQALLTIALHGGLQHSAQRVAGGEAIYHHLFDASLASRLGFSDAEFLRQHLAYSIDDDIVGLDSLFADMDVLGTIVQSFTPNAHLAALGKLAIIHASEIVSTGDSSLRMGLIDAVGGVANIALSGTIGAADLIHDFVQFSSSALQGEFFEIPTTTVSNLAVSMSGYGEEVHLASGGTMYFGTSYLDDIYGSEDDDVIISLGRDAVFYDTIRGGGGNDVIYASAGADTIHDGSGNDRAHGGIGNDTFHSGTGSDAMFGEADNDTFHLGEAEDGDVDYVNGGTHTGTGDVVEVSVGATYRLDATGAAAIRDQIVVNGFAAPTGHGIGIEMAVGDAFVQGVEIIKASADPNEIRISTYGDLQSSGVKTLDFRAGTSDAAYLETGIVNLTLDGLNGASRALFTSTTAPAFLGVDEWNLTPSTDTVTVKASHAEAAVVTINANGLDVLKLGEFWSPLTVGDGLLIDAAKLVANGFYRIETGAGDDTFHGSDRNSYFNGGTGTNTFHGSLGSDLLISTENMKVDYSASTKAVIFTWSGGNRWAYGASTDPFSFAAGDELRAGGWSEITGSVEADTLVVVGQYGTLYSNGGNDRLNGRDQDDTFVGADGYAEFISPGDGNDIVMFGTGGGELNYASSTRVADIDMEAGTYVFGNQFDIITGEFTKLVGSNLNDTIRGTEQADNIDGGGGNSVDTVYGRGGDDTIKVLRGTVYGGDGIDTITTSYSAVVYGEDGDDVITVGTYSTVYGGSHNDTISARANSFVYGDDGEDTLTASESNVVLTGGAGADTFFFQTSNSTLSYSTAAAGISLRTVGTQTHGHGSDAEGDVINGRFNLEGSGFVDDIRIDGYAGTAINTGAGDDYIEVAQKTSVTIHAGAGEDEIVVKRGQTAYGDGDNDIFHGVGTMNGGEGDDEFFLDLDYYLHTWAGSIVGVRTWAGGVVNGGAGANTIHGGGGDDTIFMQEGSDTFIFSTGGRKDTISGAGVDDVICLDGILAFSSMSDVSERLQQVGNNVLLDFGNFDDHEDVYGSNASSDWIGSIQFNGMTISQVMALDWEFA